MRHQPNEIAPITILETMADPQLFGQLFAGPSWDTWRICLGAIFGLPLGEDMLSLFQAHTGRQTAQAVAAREAWLIVGRRGGKSLIAALVAVFLACFRDYRAILAPGERGTLMVIASDKAQAGVVFGYIRGLLEGVPMLARLIQEQTKETITLTNRAVIEVHTASFRAVRGYTVIGAICDEIAFWPTEDAAEPDTEILNGLRPGMATVPGALLLCISSPYARRGALWETYQEHYGKDGDPVLVWHAATRSMNPALAEHVIAEAYAQDPSAASSNYGAEFRLDVEAFVAREAVDACVIPGRHELPPVPGVAYVAFVDPSGGSADAMTLAIAHGKDARVVLDLVRERRPPFSPEEVVKEFAETLRRYAIYTTQGDRYGGEWPRERFAVHGITYEAAEQPKSDLYRELLPLLNSGQVELLDHPRLVTQVVRLERKVASGGNDSIDHYPGGHDDLINAVAGALLAARGAAMFSETLIFWADGQRVGPWGPYGELYRRGDFLKGF